MRGPAGLPLVAVACLALAAIGCDSTPKPSGSAAPGPTTGGPTSAAIGPTDCAARIAATKLADPTSILAVDACRFSADGRKASQAALTSGATGDALWAAVWVYAASGKDAAPLVPVLQAADQSVRAMAAAALIGFGNAAGFEALRLVLNDTDPLSGSEPPVGIGEFAAATLDHSITADGLPVDAAGWATWLGSNASHLTFDATAGTWSLP